MTTKPLNLTQKEMVALVGLIRDGMLVRQVRQGLQHSPEETTERFLLDYAQAQAGYTARFSPELLERLGITG